MSDEMSDGLSPMQSTASEAMKETCAAIGDRGCGECPLDSFRRAKDVACYDLCLQYPDEVLRRLRADGNGTKQPEATAPQEDKTDWEAAAKRLQKANKQLQIELNAERKHRVQLEKDLREAREEVDKKDKLKERVVGQRDAYLNVLSMMLSKEE